MIHPNNGYENDPDGRDDEVEALINHLIHGHPAVIVVRDPGRVRSAMDPCSFCEDRSRPWYCGTPGAFRPLGAPDIHAGDVVVRCRRCDRFESNQAAQEAHDARLLVVRHRPPATLEVAPAESEGADPLVRLGQGEYQRDADVDEMVRWLVMLACALVVIAAVVSLLT